MMEFLRSILGLSKTYFLKKFLIKCKFSRPERTCPGSGTLLSDCRWTSRLPTPPPSQCCGPWPIRAWPSSEHNFQCSLWCGNAKGPTRSCFGVTGHTCFNSKSANCVHGKFIARHECPQGIAFYHESGQAGCGQIFHYFYLFLNKNAGKYASTCKFDWCSKCVYQWMVATIAIAR